jgi:hypothetical protein
MSTPLEQISCASLPFASLVALADVRCLRGVEAAVVGERVWVRWAAGDEDVLRRVLPVTGVELYARHDGMWYRLGSRLPSPGWPDAAEARPLHHVLTPAPVAPQPPPDALPGRCPMHLVRDAPLHATTALRCPLATLAAWAERATTAELDALEGVRCRDVVLLRGTRLPLLHGARRFWGDRVWMPLGYRPEPALPESALLAALEAGDDTIALLDFEGVELLPLRVFQPLTRAGVRLAIREQ